MSPRWWISALQMSSFRASLARHVEVSGQITGPSTVTRTTDATPRLLEFIFLVSKRNEKLQVSAYLTTTILYLQVGLVYCYDQSSYSGWLIRVIRLDHLHYLVNGQWRWVNDLQKAWLLSFNSASLPIFWCYRSSSSYYPRSAKFDWFQVLCGLIVLAVPSVIGLTEGLSLPRLFKLWV